MTCLFTRVICGESPKVSQRRWTKVGHRQLVHPSTPLITSVERNCLHGSLWLIQPRWSTWGTRVNAPLACACVTFNRRGHWIIATSLEYCDMMESFKILAVQSYILSLPWCAVPHWQQKFKMYKRWTWRHSQSVISYKYCRSANTTYATNNGICETSSQLLSSSGNLKRHAGQGVRTAQAAPNVFSTFQKHCVVTSLR